MLLSKHVVIPIGQEFKLQQLWQEQGILFKNIKI